MGKGKRSMMYHYTSHALAIARAELNKGDEQSADSFRIRLIGQLEKLGEDSNVNECLAVLRNTDFYSLDKVNAFHKKYKKEIYPKN